jgi:hypothetical protein
VVAGDQTGVAHCIDIEIQPIYRVRYGSRAQVRLDIMDWIEAFYNRMRRPTALGFMCLSGGK